MKITKSTLKQLIKEVLSDFDKSAREGEQFIKKLYNMEGEEDYGASVYHPTGKGRVGKPGQWVEMADRLRDMAKFWVDVEDAKMLGVVADILYAADDQFTADMNKAMGRKHTTRVRD